jgi:hypothetical protein
MGTMNEAEATAHFLAEAQKVLMEDPGLEDLGGTTRSNLLLSVRMAELAARAYAQALEDVGPLRLPLKKD